LSLCTKEKPQTRFILAPQRRDLRSTMPLGNSRFMASFSTVESDRDTRVETGARDCDSRRSVCDSIVWTAYSSCIKNEVGFFDKKDDSTLRPKELARRIQSASPRNPHGTRVGPTAAWRFNQVPLARRDLFEGGKLRWATCIQSPLQLALRTGGVPTLFAGSSLGYVWMDVWKPRDEWPRKNGG